MDKKVQATANAISPKALINIVRANGNGFGDSTGIPTALTNVNNTSMS